MCGGGSKPKAPPPPAPLPEAPRMPATEPGTLSGDTDRRRRAAAAGTTQASTILTSPRGVQGAAPGTQKTLLGE